MRIPPRLEAISFKLHYDLFSYLAASMSQFLSRGSYVLMMLVPSIREAADSLAQTYGQPRDCFQPFDGGGRQPVAPREQKFRVSENPGQRIVHFVTQNFAEVAR